METPPRLENLNLDASELSADITVDEVRAAVLVAVITSHLVVITSDLLL